jgi:RNA polymerase sigma factor (TIGR02999 family)
VHDEGRAARPIFRKDIMRSGPPDREITRLLAALDGGDGGAFDQLIPLVYDELHAIAHHRMRLEAGGHTLNTTAVVHEAYVRLVDQEPGAWRDRVHFFAVASRVMRHILIDHARARRAEKRGGGVVPVGLEEADGAQEGGVLDVLELDDALRQLAEHDPRLEQVVECRFFGGMSMEETAEAMGVSVRTATRDWRRARAYLYDALRP